MFLIQMIMLLTGLFMAAAPRACTRKESRDDREAVQRTRTMGTWLFAAAVIWILVFALQNR